VLLLHLTTTVGEGPLHLLAASVDVHERKEEVGAEECEGRAPPLLAHCIRTPSDALFLPARSSRRRVDPEMKRVSGVAAGGEGGGAENYPTVCSSIH
jgi:hypothetical protein